MSEKFSCYVMGTESLLIQCVEVLLEKGHAVRGVITSETMIADWAGKQGLPVLKPGRDLAARLGNEPFDWFLSITNLSVIPEDVLALPQKGAINFHDGPLPKYAGLYATSWALLHQEAQHGITWHVMESGLDTGDILKQRLIDLTPTETAFTLNAKCWEAGMASFPELVDELAAGTAVFTPQNLAEQTYFGKFNRPDAAATLDFTAAAEEIGALVRALDFGPYTNPLTMPKLWLNGQIFVVSQVEVLSAQATAVPGTVTAVTPDRLEIATSSTGIALTKLRKVCGQDVAIADFAQEFGITPGYRFPALEAAQVAALTELTENVAKHEEFWLRRLGQVTAVEIPYTNHSVEASQDYGLAVMDLSAAAQAQGADFLAAAFAAYLGRLSGNEAFTVGYSHAALHAAIAGFEPYFVEHVPLTVNLDFAAAAADEMGKLVQSVARSKQRLTYAQDTILRHPGLQAPTYPVLVQETAVADFSAHTAAAGSELTFLVSADGQQCAWVHDTAVYSRDAIKTMQAQFANFLGFLLDDVQRSLAATSLLSDADYRRMMVEWNDTTTDYAHNLCIHQLFQVMVARQPLETAVVFENQSITYHDLNTRANQLAHYLRKLTVGPETRVGIFMDRSIDMIVALFGILKAGGAYLPLDPTYPADRLAFMVEDAGIPVIITQSHLVEQLPPHHARVVQMDTDWSLIAQELKENVHSGVNPNNLAYVIYTSGSTGKPKGVMVQHRNAVNFFAGMDERIPHDPPGTWLAVTSLSFDISVLELFWTLSRGFKVILYADKSHDNTTFEQASPYASKPIQFSLFYFASDESEDGVADKYNLLLEGAKFADRNGFVAVWTPERHFHAFGGLYPNPSVAGAAIAVLTKNVRIRSGSCVLPLHSPVRVAEEWSLVDNLSHGRVDLAFAAGWQPNDFVLMPQNYEDRKQVMFDNIEIVKELWRGNSVTLPGPRGDVTLRTLPRPIQSELPVWITAAGNPETFYMAGKGGFNILTHLLGQSVDELSEKIKQYHKGWVDGGHPGRGHVSLMLHTFVGDDDDEVREIVRAPMKGYLRDAVNLVKAAAWYFPTFKQKAEQTGQTPGEIFESEDLTAEDMEALLDFAFERYFESSGLFGTPSTCIKMVNKLKGIDVDEIACLIDFGVPSATVVEQFGALNKVRQMAEPKAATEDYSIPAQIQRHAVTHFQCTPSMAGMLLVDEHNHAAIGSVQTMMVGGEALPLALAKQLKSLSVQNLVNMYGPTETTVWSSTSAIGGQESLITIGRPIANTEIYIVDKFMQPTPVGVAGELLIGGDGVVRLLKSARTDGRTLHSKPICG
ncbi:MAG: LLM class flavin-dependent oxidoreductase [Chloroflexota bacterium]